EAELAKRRPFTEPLDDDRSPEDIDPSDLATIERLSGAFVVTLTTRELRGLDARVLFAELTKQAEEQPAPRFVFDLQIVDVMDSACIGAMVEMQAQLQGRGGRIALVNPSEHIAYLLRLTRLDRLFPISRDVMAAITQLEQAA
ncbi:MAG: anti-sigma factor antagonist, partial [Planctomycetota bacterium]